MLPVAWIETLVERIHVSRAQIGTYTNNGNFLEWRGGRHVQGCCNDYTMSSRTDDLSMFKCVFDELTALH